MAAIIIFTLCIINLFLWFLFFKKFTRLFSTDSIIENTRAELNSMILDVNRNAERNITLIESRISDLKAAVSEADTHLSLIKAEEQKRKLGSVYKEKLDSAVHGSGSSASRAAAYKKNSLPPKSSPLKDGSSLSFAAGSESSGGKEKNPENDAQKKLFEFERQRDSSGQGGSAGENVFGDKNFNVTDGGSAAFGDSDASVSATDSAAAAKGLDGISNIYMSDDPIVIKKSFNAQVNELYRRGETVEDIAAALSRSVTEVQFALDMNE
ncbi:hypothetical protein HRQ91_06275 [Treponema parvum]|uniref:Uncharacterized protein n=1 Tax=Treponema parvum TaxID=138851 RepID=A0A975F473_9SPIR|nr:hypothetical protein [Treponema parvum]QTQ14095.1 hypothetical protein HRQ91_06275 [Treponema parvum]